MLFHPPLAWLQNLQHIKPEFMFRLLNVFNLRWLVYVNKISITLQQLCEHYPEQGVLVLNIFQRIDLTGP